MHSSDVATLGDRACHHDIPAHAADKPGTLTTRAIDDSGAVARLLIDDPGAIGRLPVDDSGAVNRGRGVDHARGHGSRIAVVRRSVAVSIGRIVRAITV